MKTLLGVAALLVLSAVGIPAARACPPGRWPWRGWACRPPVGPAPAGFVPAGAGMPVPGRSVREKLLNLAGGGAVPDDLEIVYSDLHPLHGGERFILRGDGSLVVQ